MRLAVDGIVRNAAFIALVADGREHPVQVQIAAGS